MVIKRIGPVSCAKISGTLYAILGIVFGGIFSLIALAGGFASDTSGAAGLGAIVGVAAIVVFPSFPRRSDFQSMDPCPATGGYCQPQFLTLDHRRRYLYADAGRASLHWRSGAHTSPSTCSPSALASEKEFH
jgi:hypothetical protein